jgi:hypothetical protein
MKQSGLRERKRMVPGFHCIISPLLQEAREVFLVLGRERVEVRVWQGTLNTAEGGRL